MAETQAKKKSVFETPLLSTKIKTNSVKLFPETALGYLLGPMLAMIANGVVNTYLLQYWDKVLGLGTNAALFETLLPIISAIVIVIGNLAIGRLMERKPSIAGKARPLILLGLPFIAVALLLLFLVPIPWNADGSAGLPEWYSFVMVAVGYNLYYAFAWPFYYTPHSSLVNLSSRDGSKRSLLATAANAAQLGAAGLAGMVGPFLVDALGLLPNAEKGITAEKANSLWTILMIIMIAALVLGCLMEYYFTRERITEEQFKLSAGNPKEEDATKTVKKVSMGEQVKICVKDKYWWMIIIFYFLYQLSGMLKNNDASFYAQAFSDGSSIGLAGTISALGAIPTAVGMALIWPLATKFGKAKCIRLGALWAALIGIGAIFIVNIPAISSDAAIHGTLSVTFFILKALGTVPAMYISMALMSDVLDHQEAVYGKRTDGFTMALYGSIMLAMTGVANGIILGLNSAFPYAANIGANQWLHSFLFFGGEGFAYFLIFVLFLGMNVEKFSKADHAAIIEDQKAQVLAEGGTWIEPEERAKMEEEENARLVEAARIEELKNHCAKQNLNFDEEEAKYQAKKAEADKAAAEKKAEADAKKAAKEAEKKAAWDALPAEKKAAIEAKRAAKAEKKAAEEAQAAEELAAIRAAYAASKNA